MPFASECEFKLNSSSPGILQNYFLPSTDMSQPPPGYKATQSYDIPQPQEEATIESEVEFVGAHHDDVEVVYDYKIIDLNITRKFTKT